MKKSMYLIVFVLLIVSLTACGGGGEDVALRAEDAGKEVTLQVGEKIQVTLDSNPTTGYQWDVEDVDESVLKQQGDSVYRAETSNPNIVGSGGEETFTFEAVGTGTTTLKLIYHQPWEEGVEPAEVFTLRVVVE